MYSIIILISKNFDITWIWLFCRYYELDDAVVREVLGKKLSSRHRKDLDEVSEKTNISLKSCRRQFDNIRRIHKACEEMPGHAVTNIQTMFLLSTELAKYLSNFFLICISGIVRFFLP